MRSFSSTDFDFLRQFDRKSRMLHVPNTHIVAILNIPERQRLTIQPVNETILGHVQYQILARLLAKSQLQESASRPNTFHVSFDSSSFACDHERNLPEE
jgi:hypothetical protein